MISIQTTEKSFWENLVEGYIFLMNENLETAANLQHLSKIETDFYPHVKDVLKKHKFDGKQGQSFTLTTMREKKLIQLIFIGIGKQDQCWKRELEFLRRAIGQVVLTLKKLTIESAIIALPNEEPYKVTKEELLKQIVVTSHMTDYEFTKFKSSTKDQKPFNFELLIKVPSQEMFATALEHGKIIGSAVNIGRNWSDLPANILTPVTFSEQIEELAKEHKLTCTIFGKEKAKKLGMGGFLAVDAGSDQDGKFVTLEYKTSEKNAPTIALVGKGVMFDSGGVSLKPASGMTGMKLDMSGSASVMATMIAISQIKPNVNVVGITPLVENMPSGKATKQDDIITFMNGKTAEIVNTDAEGRLILADALCYAEKTYKPNVIIDVATLTGACLHALGKFYSGLMTKSCSLREQLTEIGYLTGDRVWPLPLDDDYKAANKSEVADISNCGSPKYRAGTITAACFLQEFVESTEWAHIDIAGTDTQVPINYMGKGSPGPGIKLLIEFIMQKSK